MWVRIYISLLTPSYCFFGLLWNNCILFKMLEFSSNIDSLALDFFRGVIFFGLELVLLFGVLETNFVFLLLIMKYCPP